MHVLIGELVLLRVDDDAGISGLGDAGGGGGYVVGWRRQLRVRVVRQPELLPEGEVRVALGAAAAAGGRAEGALLLRRGRRHQALRVLVEDVRVEGCLLAVGLQELSRIVRRSHVAREPAAGVAVFVLGQRRHHRRPELELPRWRRTRRRGLRVGAEIFAAADLVCVQHQLLRLQVTEKKHASRGRQGQRATKGRRRALTSARS